MAKACASSCSCVPGCVEVCHSKRAFLFDESQSLDSRRHCQKGEMVKVRIGCSKIVPCVAPQKEAEPVKGHHEKP